METTFLVAGEFPTSGYVIQKASLAIAKSLPEQIIISLEVVKPTGAVDTVITPFEEKIGSVALTKGFHPVSVWVNGELAYSGELAVGVSVNEMLIGFDQVSGFANRATRCDIFRNGLVNYTYEPAQDLLTDGLTIKPETFAKLQSQVNAIDFGALNEDYIADPPLMDGFVYIVRCGDKKISIQQAAILPEALQALVETLVSILNRQEIIEPEIVPPPPVYNLSLACDPSAPVEGETITLILSGEFPTPGYAITNKQIRVMESYPEQLGIDLTVTEPTEPQAQVITPFKEEIGKITVLGGVHPIYVSVNGEIVFKTEIMVGQKAEAKILVFSRSGGFTGWSSQFVLFESGVARYAYDPDRGYYASEATVEPETFKALMGLIEKTDFSAFQVEYLPETPYADGYDYHLYCKETKIHIGQGATLPESLQAIFDILENIMNHQNVVEKPVTPPGEFGKLWLECEPAYATENEPITLYAVGEMFYSGFTFTKKEINVLESSPEQISLALEMETQGEQGAGPFTSFREELGTIKLGQGTHPVHCTLNGKEVKMDPIVIHGVMDQFPDETWLGFIRSGGFVGMRTMMMLFEDRSVRIRPNQPATSVEYGGYMLEETFNKLKEKLAKLDFSTLQASYEPEQPVYDGFNYEIDYQGNRVQIAQGAELPQELSDLVDVLLAILNEVQLNDSKILSFARSGGFAGWSSKYTLFEDGHVEYVYDPDRDLATYANVTPETFEKLLKLLAQTNFGAFVKEYVPETPYADGFDYHLYIYGSLYHIAQGATLPESLQAIFEILESIMNHENVVDQTDAVSSNPFELYLDTQPILPIANEPITLFVSGKFPTQGYSVVSKDIGFFESDPKKVLVSLDFKAPDERYVEDSTPFRIEVGTVTLSEGSYTVQGIVNGEKLDLGSFYVGYKAIDQFLTESWLGFMRSGGIAGWKKAMALEEDRSVRIRPNYPVGNAEFSGYVLQATFNRLQAALAKVDFSTLQSSYQPERPIYDGFNYEIDYQGKSVAIAQGAELPQELSDLVEVLISIMDGQWSTDKDATSPEGAPTAVLEWAMY